MFAAKSSANFGIHSRGYIFHGGPTLVTHPHYQQFLHFQNRLYYQNHLPTQPKFVAINTANPNLQQNNKIHAVSVTTMVPHKSKNNIFAVHSINSTPATRKIVLPLLSKSASDYSYSYSVHDATTGDQKSHTENRIGENVIGKYTLVEPDGSLRVVSYTSGKDGFKAVVKKYE